jgi:hypothetical protein
LFQERGQRRPQIRITGVDKRDCCIEKALNNLEIFRKRCALTQRGIERGFAQSRDTAIENIKLPADCPEIGFGLLTAQHKAQFVFEELYFGLRERPLDIVRACGIQQAQVTRNIHRHEDDGRKAYDGQQRPDHQPGAKNRTISIHHGSPLMIGPATIHTDGLDKT